MSEQIKPEDNNNAQMKYTNPSGEIDTMLDRALQYEGPIYGQDNPIPPLQDLATRHEKQKITIMLDKDVVDFFKQAAEDHNAKYQTMMNNCLRSYMQLINQA